MQKPISLLATLIVVGLGIVGWRVFFQSPERAIRSRLNHLAEEASFGQKESTLSKATGLFGLLDYFTTNVEVRVEARGYGAHTFNGRDELMEYVKWLRVHFSSAKLELVDIEITVNPDKKTAKANLTGKAQISGERDPWIQEMDVYLRKVDGKWLIEKVETVRTLGQIPYKTPQRKAA
jgi:hypothetical protein